MDIEQLKGLLLKPEGPTLEFKSAVYRVNHPDNSVQGRQRDELIKDVLSLANGNSITAGDIAYLVVGVADKLDDQGERPLIGIAESNLDRKRILNFVNAACEPALEDIGCEAIDIDGKVLLVITVFPTPHLHETTRELNPQSGKFNKHIVFVRHNESIDIASSQERDAIVKLKRIRFDERRNPPPAPFGAVIGGISGGSVGYAVGKKYSGNESAAIGWAVGGAIAGSIAGGSMGSTYGQIAEMRQEWPRMSVSLRWATILMISGVYFGIMSLYSYWRKRWLRGKTKNG